MPFNGSGTFVRAFNWVTDKINGVNITASRMDGDSDGFASALTNCVTRDGQGKMGAPFNPGADATYDVGAPSARWRNGYFSGPVSANGIIEPNFRILKTSQSFNTDVTAIADPQLLFVPAVGQYALEARVVISASNAAAQAAGVRLGLYQTFLNYDSGLVSIDGFLGGAVVGGPSVTYSGLGAAGYAFANALGAGTGANWFLLRGTIRINSITGATPLLGVNYGMTNQAASGTLICEPGSYLRVTRFT